MLELKREGEGGREGGREDEKIVTVFFGKNWYITWSYPVVGATPFTIRKMDSVAPSWILCLNTCINCATVSIL